jgi:DNA-binding CsgD family transcriptional regulator
MLSDAEIQQCQRVAGWLNRGIWNEELLGHLYECLVLLKQRYAGTERDTLKYQRSMLYYSGRRFLVREAKHLSQVCPVEEIDRCGCSTSQDLSTVELESIPLTVRDRKIIDGLLAGKTSGELAKELGCAQTSISYRLKNIRKRLKGKLDS